MNKTIDINAVKQFLNVAKREIANSNYVLRKRKDIDIGTSVVDYREALLDLSITPKGVRQKLLELEAEECFDISMDHDKSRDFNSEMYEFITYVNGIKTYIKMTMNEETIICLSFHRSRY